MKGIFVALILIVYTDKSIADYEAELVLQTFSCGGITIIPATKQCDGINDCADETDEKNCAPDIKCPPSRSNLCKTRFGSSGCLTKEYYNKNRYRCKGCGTAPTIKNGKVHYYKPYRKSSDIGAWAKIVCNPGFEGCTSHIRCLPSQVWQTATCNPKDECQHQLGDCTAKIYEDTRLVALRSTGCKSFCQCVHKMTNTDGSVSYKWVKQNCAPGTKFDMSLPTPVCNHENLVSCAGISCRTCKYATNINDCKYQLCADNMQSCLSVIQYSTSTNNFPKIAFAGCYKPSLADSLVKYGCVEFGSYKKCYKKCVLNKCNDHSFL